MAVDYGDEIFSSSKTCSFLKQNLAVLGGVMVSALVTGPNVRWFIPG
jgi:hypothetical protein